MGLVEFYKDKFFVPLKESLGTPVLGQLVWVPVPNLEVNPHVIEAVRHGSGHAAAKCRWTTMTDTHFTRRDAKELPILGFGLRDTEELVAFKAKKRPAVVVGTNSSVFGGTVKLKPHHEEQRLVVAPIYGVASDADPTGFSPVLSCRIRHLIYKQYFPLAEWKETRSRRECPSGSSFEPGVIRFDRLQFVHPRKPGCTLAPVRVADDVLMFLHSMLWLYLHADALPALIEMREFLASVLPAEAAPSPK